MVPRNKILIPWGRGRENKNSRSEKMKHKQATLDHERRPILELLIHVRPLQCIVRSISGTTHPTSVQISGRTAHWKDPLSFPLPPPTVHHVLSGESFVLVVGERYQGESWYKYTTLYDLSHAIPYSTTCLIYTPHCYDNPACMLISFPHPLTHDLKV